MKFSVLLPTRNRLELLSYALETVTRQDHGDWEVIVSDNCSEQDVAGYVRSLNEPRIQYYRTDRFVSVTENWNNALEKSTGEFVVMLGDDDGLMRGYFSTLRRLLDEYGHADVIYTNALLYAYPGVIREYPEGFVQPYGYAEFLRSATAPFWLDQITAQRLVRKSMNFMVSFGYNMQFALISRGIIDSLRHNGAFFQSPYPDYYAMNVLMLKAKALLVCPYPIVTIGISPKSFGYFYFNKLESKGVALLNNVQSNGIINSLDDVILPGNDMNTSWLIAMETIRVNYGANEPLQVSYARYRWLQVVHVYAAYCLDRKVAKDVLDALWARMRISEKWLAVGLWVFAMLAQGMPVALRAKVVASMLALTQTHPRYSPERIVGRDKNILDVYDRIDPLSCYS